MIPRDPGLLKMEREAHQVLGVWAEDHADGKAITVFNYSPDNPNQWIDNILLEPRPSVEKARLFGVGGVGSEVYEKLIADLQAIRASDLVRERAERNKSTLFATLHLRGTLDTAITHNALFVASEDNDFASKNLVLANFIMSRMKIVIVSPTGESMSVPVDDVLTLSGLEIRAIPPEGAADHGLDQRVVSFVGRLAMPTLAELLRQGVAFHRALTGTRGKRMVYEGEEIMVVPRVKDSDCKTSKNKTPTAIGVPMDTEPGNCKARVFEPRELETDDDVHRLMEDMVVEARKMTGEEIFYGMPEGAVPKELTA